jgi:DNA-binding NarL/FixJ family response regulator
MARRPYRVFIVEDAPLTLDALKEVIGRCRDLVCVGASSTVLEDLVPLRQARADILLLDIMLPYPYPRGFDVLARVRRELPEVRVVAYSAQRQLIKSAVALGASGVLDKDAPPEELIATLLKVGDGEQSFPASILPCTPCDPAAIQRVSRLTKRQREVGSLMANGTTSTTAIAEALGLAATTVGDFKKQMYETLEVHNDANAVRILIMGGILITDWPQ